MANVQIDEHLFLSLVVFFSNEELRQTYPEASAIGEQLENKLDKIVNRNYFTKYKTAPTATEREAARQEYLNRVGILESFRSPTEIRLRDE